MQIFNSYLSYQFLEEKLPPAYTISFWEVSRPYIYQNASVNSEHPTLSYQIKLSIFCLKSILLMSLVLIVNTSLPVGYMENNSIPPTSQKPHPSVPQMRVTGFPEKGIRLPISPELLFAKGHEPPTGKDTSVFPYRHPQQAFKLELEGSWHERANSTQSDINNLLLCKTLT